MKLCQLVEVARIDTDAVRAHILELSAEQAKIANTGVPEADLMSMVDEALD